jgi:hypothetical protein
MSLVDESVVFAWRGSFTNLEVNGLHAEAFGTRLFDESEWNWRELTTRHSLGGRMQGTLTLNPRKSFRARLSTRAYETPLKFPLATFVTQQPVAADRAKARDG